MINKVQQQTDKMSIDELVALWNETESQVKTLELATVRGAIMNTLEAKDPTKFNKWMSAEYPNHKIELYFGGKLCTL